MTKLPQLYFYRNRTTGELLVSPQPQSAPMYRALPIASESDTDVKHLPNIELFEEGLLITVGKSLHNNLPSRHIERVVLQWANGLREWDVKGQANRGFPTAIVVPTAEVPKGECNVYVCCSKRGVFVSSFFAPKLQCAFPAAMFYNSETKCYVVRIIDLPEVVATGPTKDEAYLQAKIELTFALHCAEHQGIVPTPLAIAKQKHPQAFMVEL